VTSGNCALSIFCTDGSKEHLWHPVTVHLAYSAHGIVLKSLCNNNKRTFLWNKLVNMKLHFVSLCTIHFSVWQILRSLEGEVKRSVIHHINCIAFRLILLSNNKSCRYKIWNSCRWIIWQKIAIKISLKVYRYQINRQIPDTHKYMCAEILVRAVCLRLRIWNRCLNLIIFTSSIRQGLHAALNFSLLTC
jgi:hypothetical protein